MEQIRYYSALAIGAVAWAVGAYFNARYGLQASSHVLDGVAYATAAVTIDLLKARLPFISEQAKRENDAARRVLASIAFVLFTAFSLHCAFGYISLAQNEQGKERREHETIVQSLISEIRELEDQRSALGGVRDSRLLGQVLEALEQEPRWVPSKGCTDATIAVSQAFCRRYEGTKEELERSLEGERIDQVIVEAKTRLETELRKLAQSKGSVTTGTLLGSVLGWSSQSINFTVLVIFTISIEFGSGFGFYLVMSKRPLEEVELHPVSEHRALPKPDGRDAFIVDCLELDPTAREKSTVVFRRYQQWSQEKGERFFSGRDEFEKWVVERLGVSKIKEGNRWVLVGIGVKDI